MRKILAILALCIIFLMSGKCQTITFSQVTSTYVTQSDNYKMTVNADSTVDSSLVVLYGNNGDTIWIPILSIYYRHGTINAEEGQYNAPAYKYYRAEAVNKVGTGNFYITIKN